MRRLMFVLAVMCAFAASAEIIEQEIDGLKYRLDTEAGTAELFGYTVSPTEVNVSEVEHNGQKYIVTLVGWNAFRGCDSLIGVSLPNVTSLNPKAFEICGSLKNVSLPNVTSVGYDAFRWCDSMTEISLPNVTSLETGVFDCCGSLKTVSLPNATSIGQGVFRWCDAMTKISLPKVTLLGPGAFENCKSLKNIELPNVTSVGAEAFWHCFELSVMYVSKSTKNMLESNRSYYSLNDTAKLIYPPTLTRWEVEEARYDVHEADVKVEYKITPSSVTLLSGGVQIDEEDYENDSYYYGVTPQTRPETPYTPTADDFKVVPSDAQIVKEGEIAISKEAIAAPSAETMTVADNRVQLGVSILKTADLTAEKKDWGEVILTADDVRVVDGKIIISVPVDSATGFMILQSKDAKIVEETDHD